MLSIQQLIRALRMLQNSAASVSAGSGGGSGGVSSADLVKTLRQAVATAATTTTSTQTPQMTSLQQTSSSSALSPNQQQQEQTDAGAAAEAHESATDSSQQQQQHQSSSLTEQQQLFSHTSPLNENGSLLAQSSCLKDTITAHSSSAAAAAAYSIGHRYQQIPKIHQQQLHHIHTQQNTTNPLYSKQKQAQFAMSSLAAEPLAATASLQNEDSPAGSGVSCADESAAGTTENPKQSNSSAGRPCFNTGLAQILQFMELIGNLKHTKRTGWVLRDVSDCESISGHMYRMSMMTFLLDGTEGLNQIRCMELALVHDLAESLVGDITPFCGISKEDKRAMELKAMEDICKLIEPRGKRIMELFEEYEHGVSAESKFVKDLDRLDMVMQAFEYEKRDNCLLKHQEFFDSTEGKFQHPFVKKLVSEIYEQRRNLAKAKGATPPPAIKVPDWEAADALRKSSAATTPINGHCLAEQQQQQQKSSSSSTS